MVFCHKAPAWVCARIQHSGFSSILSGKHWLGRGVIVRAMQAVSSHAQVCESVEERLLLSLPLSFFSFSRDGVVVMSIDNLPCQLPREATEYFGNCLMPHVQDFVSYQTKLLRHGQELPS